MHLNHRLTYMIYKDCGDPTPFPKSKVTTANIAAHMTGFIGEQILGQTEHLGHTLSNKAIYQVSLCGYSQMFYCTLLTKCLV